MIRIAALTCDITFAHRQLHYCAGLLHSEYDRPAAVFIPSAMYLRVRGHYLRDINWGPRFYNITYTTATHRFNGVQSHWYYEGDLHRDYGPAIAGRHTQRNGSTESWWYKYSRGVPMLATALNTFTAGALDASGALDAVGARDAAGALDVATELVKKPLSPFSPQLLSYCAGGQRCGCVVMVAREMIAHFSAVAEQEYSYGPACVYQTCTGLIVEYLRADQDTTEYTYYRIGSCCARNRQCDRVGSSCKENAMVVVDDSANGVFNTEIVDWDIHRLN
jgi:hypothetical protein